MELRKILLLYIDLWLRFLHQNVLDNLLPEGELKISRRCSLDISCDELDMRVQMEEWNPEYQKQVLFTTCKQPRKEQLNICCCFLMKLIISF